MHFPESSCLIRCYFYPTTGVHRGASAVCTSFDHLVPIRVLLVIEIVRERKS
jgi:hypothetical protein